LPSASYVFASTAVAEIRENSAEALALAGLPDDLFMTLLTEDATEFIAALPTRAAALRLREARHRNRQKAWERNDMNDVAYNACAVVHCDVVVTENLWADMLRQSHVAEEHGTTILTNVADLRDVLAAAS